MESNKDIKRKKDKYSDDDDYRREMKSKRARSRSRSPAEVREKDGRRKRRHSRSKSLDRPVKHEKQREELPKEREVRNAAAERRAKNTDMLNTRTGGAYIPPARLRMMQAQITDKSSIAYQRLAWEALKKSIHGHINKINVGNIGIIIKELLKENIVRGRGLLCRSVIQAQAASPTFTNVYAALVAAVNSRFPNIGELLLKRLVIQFKRGFKRNDKPICISSASFIAHLVNQRVAHEILALELLTLLVETPTDDSVEVAISFLKECGQKLTEVSSKGVNAIFEMLRNILHEGQLDKRVQYMIEVMFQVWKDGFKDHPALIEELELVPEEEQFTHLLMLDDATDPQDILNVFKLDEKYEENEQKYKTLSKEILGSDAESDEEGGSGESGSEGSEEEDEEEEKKEGMTIIDNTETNLVALRRTIYLTINSSLDFEECAHKLMKMQLKPGQEVELCHMFLDCCAEQRTYEKFYGLLAQRFCNINRIYIGPFEEIFKDSYSTAHRLDTNRLRNVSKFFAHLLFTDSISWEVLDCVKLNEEDTTSSSRIYIKILFQELAEYMGLKKLNDRLKDPTLQEAFLGVFPRDNPKNTRFSINFFTSIGLGGLTDELREHLKQMPKNVPALVTEIKLDSESSSDSSSSSSSSSSDSSSDSEDEGGSGKKGDKNKKSKKHNDKDESPKTPQEEPKSNEDKERWGHDGFYDTYGKDARRHEPRTDRRGDAGYRDQDNFVRSRDGRQDASTVNRSREAQRGQDFRRNDESRRRDDNNRKEEDVNRRRIREDDGRYTRDDRNADREGSRQYVNRQNDGETGRHSGNERRRDREDRNGERVDERHRNRDDRSGDREDSRRANTRQEDVRRRNHDDDERRDIENRSGNTEVSTRSKRDDNESRRSRIDEDTGPIQESKNRDEEQRNRDDHNKKKSDKEDRGKKNKGIELGDEEYKSRRHEKEYRNDKYEKQRERISDDKRSTRDDRKKDDKDNRKTKSAREDKRNRSDEVDSSEEEYRSTRHEKDDKHNRKEKNRDAESRTKGNNIKKEKESSSEDDSKSTKRKKDRRRKENKIDPDSWDIRRGSSIRKEVVGRYWDH